MKTLGLAILAVGLLGATGAAANEREPVTLRIDASRVNFADPAAVAQFRRDVNRQIAAACNPGNRLNADDRPDFRCRRELAATLDPAVVQLAARANAGRQAFAGTQ